MQIDIQFVCLRVGVIDLLRRGSGQARRQCGRGGQAGEHPEGAVSEVQIGLWHESLRPRKRVAISYRPRLDPRKDLSWTCFADGMERMMRKRLPVAAAVALIVCGIHQPACSAAAARDLDTAGAPIRPERADPAISKALN